MTIHHETIQLEHRFTAPPKKLFSAYKDNGAREIWSAPNDETMVKIVHADVKTGGTEATICGSKSDPQFRTEVCYHHVKENEVICLTETLFQGDNVLTVALITLEFLTTEVSETTLRLTDQVTSFVGREAVQGHKQGFAAALKNLSRYIANEIPREVF